MNLNIEDEFDELDVWNTAFVAVETLFDGDNINENLKKVLFLISNFMSSKEVYVYKYNSDIDKMSCISHLGNDCEIDSLNDRITKIYVNTSENSYIVNIIGDNIIDDRLYRKYKSVLKRLFKLIFMRIEFREKLFIASTTDSLTHTFNRSYYNTIANEIFKNDDTIITYSLIDLFRLKYINDNYGHKYGDKYIIKVSELIAKSLEPEDMLFRIGGDEFVILSKTMKKEDMVKKLEDINIKLSGENLDLNIPFLLNINYGVVEGKSDLDTFYSESDELLSQHKALTYKKMNIDRRK